MRYQLKKPALLLLKDGTIFKGSSIGIEGEAVGEICFNTGMTGYQEIFTDPSYYGQLMVTTNAHVGNYGVVENEVESNAIKIAGLICKNFSHQYSRYGNTKSLYDEFVQQKRMAICDIDTRALVRHITKNGAMNAIISTAINDIDRLKSKLNEAPEMEGLELVSKVSTKEVYYCGNSNSKYKVSVVDLGIKKSILDNLSDRGCYLKVYPYHSTFEQLSDWNPDGYFLSNGPGDPEPLKQVQKLAKTIIDKKLPLFGICLGHQIIALSQGISTYKMHNGHRGVNHPIKNLKIGKGEITSQNHGFVVDKEEIKNGEEIEITHIHLNDHTVAGIRLKNSNCFSVQYHPEASPGPNDSKYLFDEFIEIINN